MNKLRQIGIITQVNNISVALLQLYQSFEHINKKFSNSNIFYIQGLKLLLYVGLKEEE